MKYSSWEMCSLHITYTFKIKIRIDHAISIFFNTPHLCKVSSHVINCYLYDKKGKNK